MTIGLTEVSAFEARHLQCAQCLPGMSSLGSCTVSGWVSGSVDLLGVKKSPDKRKVTASQATKVSVKAFKASVSELFALFQSLKICFYYVGLNYLIH